MQQPPGNPHIGNDSRCGFTLLEIIGVLLILSVLAITALSHYRTLLEDSKLRGAQNLISAAQTQLSLEFSRRAVSGQALDIDAQNICNWVIVNSPEVAASVSCAGNIDGNVSILANIEGKNVIGDWNSPLSGGS